MMGVKAMSQAHQPRMGQKGGKYRGLVLRIWPSLQEGSKRVRANHGPEDTDWEQRHLEKSKGIRRPWSFSSQKCHF